MPRSKLDGLADLKRELTHPDGGRRPSLPAAGLPEMPRPPADTAPLQLRLPEDLRRKLGARAADRLRQEGRNITIQTIIVEILEKELADG